MRKDSGTSAGLVVARCIGKVQNEILPRRPGGKAPASGESDQTSAGVQRRSRVLLNNTAGLQCRGGTTSVVAPLRFSVAWPNKLAGKSGCQCAWRAVASHARAESTGGDQQSSPATAPFTPPDKFTHHRRHRRFRNGDYWRVMPGAAAQWAHDGIRASKQMREHAVSSTSRDQASCRLRDAETARQRSSGGRSFLPEKNRPQLK